MRWLFVLGVSFDLAGALLIASAVTGRTPAENRQEAKAYWGANFWVILFREREQARVRYGIYLLICGFTLQLAGYVWAFESWAAAWATAAALAAIGLGFLASRRQADASVPLKYHDKLQLPESIGDERRAYQLADWDEVLTWRRVYADRMLGRLLDEAEETVRPEVNGGRWIADCPRCGSSMLASPGLDTVTCLSKCALVFRAEFPPEREQIEALLILRPETNRFWKPGTSVEELRAENRTQGWPADSPS
ncbi:MAG: hypothetical protein ACRDOS_07045 [Gaiellaceae bacterium]